jgi:PKD repeat protein
MITPHKPLAPARLVLLLAMLPMAVLAQQSPFVVLHNTTVNSCQCYTFGNGQVNQHGSIWNRNRLDLTQPFDFRFRVKMLDENVWNADGMAFVLQRDTVSFMTAAGTPGYSDIPESVAIELDIFQNDPSGDPGSDHVAIMANGSTDHNGAGNLAGPTDIYPFNLYLTDGDWHDVRITWEPQNTRLRAYFAPNPLPVIQYVGDLVTDVFGGDPLVYWGWTAGCGGIPGVFDLCWDQSVTMGTVPATICGVQTIDLAQTSTTDLGSITEVVWDMGDGNQVTGPTGTYSYAQPGPYTVTVSAYDVSGCAATQTQSVNVLPEPDATFTASDGCTGAPIGISGPAAGTQFVWTLNGTQVSTDQQPVIVSTAAGSNTIGLTVGPIGCQGTYSTTVMLNQGPIATFSVPDHCLGEEVSLAFVDGQSLASAAVDVDLGDGTTGTGTQVAHTYAAAGGYLVEVSATAGGCTSSATDSVYVWGTVPQTSVSGNSITVTNGPYTSYQWYLEGVLIANATASAYSPSASGNYTVVATDAHGCETTSVIVEFTYIGIGELDGVSGLVAFAMDGEIVLKADFNSGAEYQIVVTDLTGRGIATGLWPTEPGSNTLRINVPSALAGGIYIVSIQHGTERLVKRIAVQ